VRRTSGIASTGHRSLSWSKVVSTCEGFSDAAAFSRIQPFPSSIAQNITRILRKDQFARRSRLRCRERRQNTQQLVLDSEINRTIAGQLAIELERNVLLARYAQAPRLKVFNFRNSDLGAENDVLEILDDFEIAEPFEHDDIKQAVIHNGLLEEWKRTSIQAPVSNENE
jgi:hypothetical protein